MTIGNIKVTVGQATNPRTTAITYGSRTLKSATDLSLENVQDGDTITYQANTNTFVMSNTIAIAEQVVTNLVGRIDGGTF